jgi:hypothetical protein
VVAPKDNSICEQARAFYYDCLCGRGQESTPPEVFAHLCQCSFCKAEVDRLKAELTGTDGDADRGIGQRSSLVIANLKLHFAHTGALVNCGTARPFLPSLADPAFEVGVPTPITVHLDKCQQCSDDLETIRQLKLTHKQLCRLGQLFAEEFGVDEELCTKAQTAISAVGDCVFEGTSVDILRHFCVCPDCRELLYKYRRSKTEKLSWSAEQSVIPCDAVSATDTFDYVVLYGLDPEKDEYAMFRPALTSHLTNCRKCLGKMLELHNTVYDILQRAESGIVTCFKVDDATQHSIVSNPDEIYRDWPIEVEVFATSRETGTTKAKEAGAVGLVTAKSELKLKQRRLRLGIRPLIKPVAAAAAILIVVLLGVYGSIAKAVDLDQIYEALARIKNVYIATYALEKPEPAQEIWISTELNVKMFNTGLQYVLWDLTDKTVKSKDSDTDAVKTAQLSEYTLVEVRSTMDVPWGLLPFDNIAAVPQYAQWERVDDENIDAAIPNTEVYDLVWTEKTLSGSTIYEKWRGYLDVKTKLPKRTELWEKFSEEEEYEILTVTEVTYPTTDEVQTAIRDAGLYVSSTLLRQP